MSKVKEMIDAMASHSMISREHQIGLATLNIDHIDAKAQKPADTVKNMSLFEKSNSMLIDRKTTNEISAKETNKYNTIL